ncbi:hypothetical protein [Nakamurella endophytica]|nr:hypothetical protein [Nakamurella endophytica]
MLASLGLPWQRGGIKPGFDWAWNPGYCTVTWDGYSRCTTWDLVPDVAYKAVGPIPGTQLPVRVLVVATVVLLWAGWRRAARAAAGAGLALGVGAVLIGGASVTSGRLLFVVALALLATTLHAGGLVGRRRSPGPTAGVRSGMPAGMHGASRP